jgi:PAS domain S-box-containing protein
MDGNEGYYREVFENAPVAVMIEDFSELKTHLDDLGSRGIVDLRSHLVDDSQALFRCAALARIVDVNAAALELFGADSKEALLADLPRIFTEASWNGFRENLLALAQGGRSNETQTVNRTLAGETIHVILRWTLPPDSRDTWGRVIVSILDVTSRVRAEEALRSSEARHRDLCAHLPESVYEADMEGKITFANQTALQAFGYTEQDIEAGLPVIALIAAGDQARASRNIQRVIAGEDVGANEYVVSRKDGNIFPALVRTRPISDHGGSIVGFRGVAVDISDRKRVEEERETLIKELQQALAKIKTLHGLIPICASCKNVRDDDGYWHKVETYIREHSAAEFSHSICPECRKKLYPEKKPPDPKR